MFVGSKALQKALCEYFGTVVNLCTKIVLFSRESFIVQLPKLILPFEAAFGDIQKELHRHAILVQDEISLSATKRQQDESSLQSTERKENARFRTLATFFKEQSLSETRLVNKRLQKQERSIFLDKLSNYNHVSAWKQARNKGHVTWIIEHAEYNTWKATSTSGILCLLGNLGAGKTVLLASVVADLVLQPYVTVGYFFCRFDDTKSLQATTIVASIARQLLLDHEFNVPQVSSDQQDPEEATDLLATLLPRKLSQRYVICIDGLDECEESQRSQVLVCLRKLVEIPGLNLKVVYTVRPDSQQTIVPILGQHDSISMSSVATEDEITGYVQDSLEKSLEHGVLRVQDPTLILRIKEELVENADGMYLWVYFQLRSICQQTSDEDIIQTLEDLPKDMDETYARILRRLDKDSAKGRRILATVAAAERPMTTEELREALAVEPGNTTFKASSLSNNISATLARCAGSLLAVDEEDLTVRFVHQSVRQFLTDRIAIDSELTHYRIDVEQANLLLGEVCVTYLNFGVFNSQLVKAKDPALWKDVSPRTILQTTLPEETMASKLALRILKGAKTAQGSLGQQLDNLAAMNKTPGLTHAFLAYAREYVLTHTKALLDCDPTIEILFWKVIRGSLEVVQCPWALSADLGSKVAWIPWAVEHEHIGLLYRSMTRLPVVKMGAQLGRYKESINVDDNIAMEVFKLAFALRKENVVRFLVQTFDILPKHKSDLLLPLVASGMDIPPDWHGKHLQSTMKQNFIVKPHQLQAWGIDMLPRRMRLRDGVIEVIEEYVEWDLFTLAAASNNTGVIGAFWDNAILERQEELSPLLSGGPILRAAQQAACYDHPGVFKYLLQLPSASIHMPRTTRGKEQTWDPDMHGWDLVQYAATFKDRSLFVELSQGYRRRTGPCTFPQIVNLLANRFPRRVYRFDDVQKEVVVGSTFDEILSSGPNVASPVSTPDQPRRRLFARRGAQRKPQPLVDHPTGLEVVSNTGDEEDPVIRMLASLPGRFRDDELGEDHQGNMGNWRRSSAGEWRRDVDEPVTGLRPTGADKRSYGPSDRQNLQPAEVQAKLGPQCNINKDLLDAKAGEDGSTTPGFSSETTAVVSDTASSEPKWEMLNAEDESRIFQDAVRTKTNIPSHEILLPKFSRPKRPRKRPTAVEDKFVAFLTSSKEQSLQPRFSMTMASVNGKLELQAQTLRAQTVAIEAQAALLKASRGTDERRWWDNHMLVFLFGLFWPAVFLACFAYMMQPHVPVSWAHGGKDGTCGLNDL